MPCVMGILNTTPDSFSDGGRFYSVSAALQRTEQMITEGAAIIDIGGESTRPGSEPVSEKEEVQRVIPVLEQAVSRFPETLFSVDTTKYEVARQALQAGASIINDVSGLQDEPRLADLCARHNAAIILMHRQGMPKDMQNNPSYDDVIQEISSFLFMQAERAIKAGVSGVIIDPGIGFGKTWQHNLQIIRYLHTFSASGYPVMIGASRKSVIGHILADEQGDRPVDKRLAGTLAMHYHALVNGASILRVHDVREACDSLSVYNAIMAR